MIINTPTSPPPPPKIWNQIIRIAVMENELQTQKVKLKLKNSQFSCSNETRNNMIMI